MVDQEEEDLQMALRMSLQPSPPEAKRSKPLENAAAAPDESPEAKNRRLQRELRAAAAEKRMLAAKSSVAPAKAEKGVAVGHTGSGAKADAAAACSQEKGRDVTSGGEELSASDADQLFSMVFGNSVSRDILAQWSNQGIRDIASWCMGIEDLACVGGPFFMSISINLKEPMDDGDDSLSRLTIVSFGNPQMVVVLGLSEISKSYRESFGPVRNRGLLFFNLKEHPQMVVVLGWIQHLASGHFPSIQFLCSSAIDYLSFIVQA
ncbi:hypothetical protein ACLOJK_034666 [Asimina triloba]